MNKRTEKDKDELFDCSEIDASMKREYVEVDLNALYDRAYAELGLQQTKRDQIITLYLAMFSFLIPFALSLDALSWQIKGLVFMAAAIVGVLFSLIIIRYRVYKEVYWLCCQSLTVLFGIQSEALNKKVIQSIYYKTLEKKGKSFLKEEADKVKKFSKMLYVKKNLFSSESIYFFIHAFITSLIFGLSIGLICETSMHTSIFVGVLLGIVLFILLSKKYFSECIKVYGVLIDGKDSSFNSTFSKAWFLHFYV